MLERAERIHCSNVGAASPDLHIVLSKQKDLHCPDAVLRDSLPEAMKAGRRETRLDTTRTEPIVIAKQIRIIGQVDGGW